MTPVPSPSRYRLRARAIWRLRRNDRWAMKILHRHGFFDRPLTIEPPIVDNSRRTGNG